MRSPSLLTVLAAALVATASPTRAEAPGKPSSPHFAKDFHRRLRFLLQEAPEVDQKAAETLIATGGLRFVVKAWEETRRTLIPAAGPPVVPKIQTASAGNGDGAGRAEDTLAEVIRTADAALDKARKGVRWKRGRAFQKRAGTEWTVEYKAGGKAGLRATVKVDLATGDVKIR